VLSAGGSGRADSDESTPNTSNGWRFCWAGILLIEVVVAVCEFGGALFIPLTVSINLFHKPGYPLTPNLHSWGDPGGKCPVRGAGGGDEKYHTKRKIQKKKSPVLRCVRSLIVYCSALIQDRYCQAFARGCGAMLALDLTGYRKNR